MDSFSRSWYRLSFENAYLRRKGDAFQDLFADVMSRRYSEDYIRTRPWGNVGDRKNDGYLKSQRQLFQLHAPNEMASSQTMSKIKEDFNGALPFWEEHFDEWTFVHNARNGLGPDVLALILELDSKHPSITVGHWGYEMFEREVMRLSEDDLAALFGFAPNTSHLNTVRSSDIATVLSSLSQVEPSDVDIRPISQHKIDRNKLSLDSKNYLQFGQRKSHLVERIIDALADPLAGERIAQGFRAKYQDLKLQGLEPDTILSELIAFAGGYGAYATIDADRQRTEAAVAAVTAYLFERCDIFEDVDGVKT